MATEPNKNAGETAPEAQEKPGKYAVYDMNQRGAAGRKHEVITKVYPKREDGFVPEPDTQSYELFADRPCAMPMEHALKFLTDPAFKVLNPKGVRIMPVPKIDLSKPIKSLAENEMIVTIDELSNDALVRRVRVLPGSEDIPEDAKRADLVAFLVNWRKSLKGKTSGQQALEEMMLNGALDGSMSPDQLERMFPSSSTNLRRVATA